MIDKIVVKENFEATGSKTIKYRTLTGWTSDRAKAKRFYSERGLKTCITRQKNDHSLSVKIYSEDYINGVVTE